MMKPVASFACLLLLTLALFPAGVMAQSKADINKRVDNLVGKHYMDGVPYLVAHKLGPTALPYLFELLANPEQKKFWVNIIVTIGFIEDPSAVEPLVAFLEDTQGEVDPFKFRAILSVPYALGCIASGGDDGALQYLAGKLEAPQKHASRWSYRGLPITELIAEQSVMAIAISGRPEARRLLLDLPAPKARALNNQVTQGLAIMDRIATEGRAAVLNPPHRKREEMQR